MIIDDYNNDDWPAAPPMCALLDTVHHADIFDLCGALAAGSVDMILCDLPYGTTACAWDTVIPFAPMWAAFKRVIKPRGAIVLTASQPFTSALVMSNPGMFRYEWIWDKKMPTGHLNAKAMPLKQHESILIFCDEMPVYYPQFIPTEKRVKTRRPQTYSGNQAYGTYTVTTQAYDDYHPRSLINISNANQADKQHPTQKPVDLFRYLIRTYTQPGELVFDPCTGSGTTAVAAVWEGRRFIVGDSSPEYVAIAKQRLSTDFGKVQSGDKQPITDLPLFAQKPA